MILKKPFYAILLILAACSTEDNSVEIDSVNLTLRPNTIGSGRMIECGTVEPQGFQRITPADYTVPNNGVTFGLKIHVVRDDNGENPVLDSDQIANIAPILNEYFDNALGTGPITSILPFDYINFSENIEINYIDNSDFYYVDVNNNSHPNLPNLEDFWEIDNDPTKFNIYFTRRIQINPNPDAFFLGYANVGGVHSVVSTDGHLSDRNREGVMTHEIGHNFGLYHTWANLGHNEPRCVSNTNYSFDTGDLVLDTPFDGNNFSVRDFCTVNPDLYDEVNPTDVCGESIPIKNFHNLTGNFMSRGNAGCRSNFTLGQMQRMAYIYNVNVRLRMLNPDADGVIF